MGRVMPTQTNSAGTPWPLWLGAAALTSTVLGGQWDLAWHRSIGRDSFWTPAHVMVYVGGLLAAALCVAMIARCMRYDDVPAVRVLGLRAPLGIFLVGWGGVAMLTSAPFDNWWHNAYGLDVTIMSPPHILLLLGERAVALGLLLFAAATMNRAEGSAQFTKLQHIFLYLGALTVTSQMLFLEGFTLDYVLHNVRAYLVLGIAIPPLLAALSQASRFRWTATVCATVYTLLLVAEILVLPLFPAHPQLGPVYFPLTHMVPTKFPLLLLAPAIALDVLWQRTRSWGVWQIALASGVVFIAALVTFEWPFASFLLSHASENRFFGTMYFNFNARTDGANRLRLFLAPQSGVRLFVGLAAASVCAAVTSFVGLMFGRWMREVQR